jgi:CubicO group peptidase (beta-lactamase class C family)
MVSSLGILSMALLSLLLTTYCLLPTSYYITWLFIPPMRVLIPLIIVLLAGCTRPSEKESRNLNDQLDSLFLAHVNTNGPGGAFLVATGDSVIFSKGYGIADVNSREAITTKTLFNLGSISKTFVSNTILILQLEGKLSVEDSLIKYFPGFKNKDIARKVKIKHLLTHTSGLPDNRPVSKDSVFYLTAKDAENWYPVTQTDTLVFEPGTRYEYSNPAFNGLALIIEKVTGKKWQDVVADRIFNPSGMTTSTITDGPHPQSGVAHAYVEFNNAWKEDDYGEEPTFCAAGNGGVWSSVEELFNYEKSMKYSQFSTADVLADARTIKVFPQWSSPQLPFIGWSWFFDRTDSGLQTIGHTGTQGGFYCNYVTVPDKDLLFIMLCNFPIDREVLTNDVLTLLEKTENQSL